MTPAEQGFLLLTGHLGNPERLPLTVAQFRTLTLRARQMPQPTENRVLRTEDLRELGYDREMSLRIIRLMEDRGVLQQYVRRGATQNCVPLTRVSQGYPETVRTKLGLDAPGCIWARGNCSLLDRPAISLVGSRELLQENREFAQEAGKQAALQGYVLVSGNARGADRTAQESCLSWGGAVISVVADRLCDHTPSGQILYLSEDGFDEEFSAQRALSRNRVIHCLGQVVLAAQCNLEQGGTWDGTVKNLRRRWTPVCCFADGSPGIRSLIQMGANPIIKDKLKDLKALLPWEIEMQMEDFL